MLYAHKPDEGRHARQASFWLGEGMLFFGCYALSVELGGVTALRTPVISSVPEVPLLGIPLTGSFVVASLVFLALSFIYLRMLAKPKVADHLIEVEGEVRKVTWPSFEEATNSSIVVIVTVLVLMGFLAAADFLLGRIINPILF